MEAVTKIITDLTRSEEREDLKQESILSVIENSFDGMDI